MSEIVVSYDREAMLTNSVVALVVFGCAAAIGLATLGDPYSNQARIYLSLDPPFGDWGGADRVGG
ncbi:MAG: hypothetical protein AAGA65_29305 [Actinomycetota bacterium]